MNVATVHTFVIALVTIAFASVSGRAQSDLTEVTDPVAYAVYAAVLPRYWKATSKDAIRLVRETVDVKQGLRCLGPQPRRAVDPEWEPVEAAFKLANSREHLLLPLLQIDVGYQLVPRADIVADDARLALKYPGVWQRLPESLEFAAVSAVGFNAAKDKAIVYVTLRMQGELMSLEMRDGQWRPAAERLGCGWIA
jgi:hypothetical protein